MLQANRDIFIQNIFSLSAPYIDFLSRTLSFGLSSYWRGKLVSLSEVREGEKVLDVCTGTGQTAVLIAKRVGAQGSVTGIDFCRDMLEIARQKTNSHPGTLSFLLADAKDLPFPDNTFDAVTVAFGMRNISDTIPALREIKRVLKRGGKFYCLELTRPEKRWFLSLYKFYVFHIMPLFGKIIVKSSIPYNYLPSSIFTFYSPEEFQHIIGECGFDSIRVHSMTLGAATIFGASKNG